MVYTAKIYKIVNTINDDIYIGSTRNELRLRWSQHKKDQKKKPIQNRLYEMMAQNPIECFRMILIEEVECQNKQIQLQHEQRYIDQFKPKLNKRNPFGQKCEHDIQRSACKDCSGSQICEHNRQRSTCKDCGGSQICEHNKQRSQCKDCGGSQICEHDKIRYACKDCGGCRTQQVYCYDCNCEIRRDTLSKHQKTIKHLQNVLPINL